MRAHHEKSLSQRFSILRNDFSSYYLMINTMETSLILMILQTCCFITAWLLIDRHVTHHGPIPAARTLNRWHSRVYSVLSALLLYLTLSPTHDEAARTLYHISKFWEYIDVLTVRAGGGLIDLHFGFHHLTTPYLTFFRVLRNSEGWRTFTALNTAHHALMYAYFGGASAFRPVLDFTGCAQLVIGIIMEATMLWSRDTDEVRVLPHVFAAGLLGSYLVLWAREMTMRRIERSEVKNT
ncbi:hypothetical protein F5Y10DRAFT_235293 [Nemania abortiva]|nr:hypothetical protein F5Y10DRAFT_235293 [Nemania abortiva]